MDIDFKALIDQFAQLIKDFTKLIKDFVNSWKKELKFEAPAAEE